MQLTRSTAGVSERYALPAGQSFGLWGAQAGCRCHVESNENKPYEFVGVVRPVVRGYHELHDPNEVNGNGFHPLRHVELHATPRDTSPGVRGTTPPRIKRRFCRGEHCSPDEMSENGIKTACSMWFAYEPRPRPTSPPRIKRTKMRISSIIRMAHRLRRS